jgi:hypothetical protein
VTVNNIFGLFEDVERCRYNNKLANIFRSLLRFFQNKQKFNNCLAISIRMNNDYFKSLLSNYSDEQAQKLLAAGLFKKKIQNPFSDRFTSA